MTTQLDVWVGALLTLMIFSFLYRDNPMYKFAEHLFVGVSAAYWMVQGYRQQIVPNLFAKLLPGQFESVVPAAQADRKERNTCSWRGAGRRAASSDAPRASS